MEQYKGALSNMTEEEVDKLFEGCHGNLDAPLSGEVYFPTCHGCKNLVDSPNVYLNDPTCKIFGKLPDKYWQDDMHTCPYRIQDETML